MRSPGRHGRSAAGYGIALWRLHPRLLVDFVLFRGDVVDTPMVENDEHDCENRDDGAFDRHVGDDRVSP